MPVEGEIYVGQGHLWQGDCLDILPKLKAASAQCIIADPPYYNVLENHAWDCQWPTETSYLEWTTRWVQQAQRILKPDGLMFICGQLGKREHVWLHLCSEMAKIMQFHDMIIWDRVVGYNERRDSFTPQYEMVLVLRHKGCDKPYFDKDAVRLPYDNATIQNYMRDKRYKDPIARREHLEKGKYATNILKVPSLKGSSQEKVGHPSQKPLALLRHLITASTRVGDTVLDPFMGSGSTACAAEQLGRAWVGIESDAGYVQMAVARLKNQQQAESLPLLAEGAHAR